MLPTHKQLLLESGLIPQHVEEHKSVIYMLDPQVRIVYCNAFWDEFALANGGEKLLRKDTIGIVLLDVVPDVLRFFYRERFEQVQLTQKVWEHDYECSSPEQYRLFRMRVVCLGAGHLIVDNSLRVEQEHGVLRSVAFPWSHNYLNADGIVTMCMHCRRTKRVAELPETLAGLAETVWDWVPSFVHKPPKWVSAGICRMCYPLFFGTLNDGTGGPFIPNPC